MALLVWMVIYPAITIISIALGDWPAQLQVLARTLVLPGILVPFMIFLLCLK